MNAPEQKYALWRSPAREQP